MSPKPCLFTTLANDFFIELYRRISWRRVAHPMGWMVLNPLPPLVILFIWFTVVIFELLWDILSFLDRFSHCSRHNPTKLWFLPPIVKRHFRCLPLKIKKSVWLYHCELYFCRKNAFCRYWFHVLNEYFITCFKWNPTIFWTVLILSEIYHRPPTRGVILGKHSYDSISALIIITQP